MIKRRKWSDEEVVEWAVAYVDYGFTIEELEILLEVPHSTIAWGLLHRLPNIDLELYVRVEKSVYAHRGAGQNKRHEKRRATA